MWSLEVNPRGGKMKSSLDKEIAGLVHKLNKAGYKTYKSCCGHGRKNGYVRFKYAIPEADRKSIEGWNKKGRLEFISPYVMWTWNVDPPRRKK
jgi:hypothetical protein